MSTYESVLVPAPTAAPRGAIWIGQLVSRLMARRPAAPAPVVSPREREAAEVREMALGLMATDPRFAADLMAAADRHARGG